MTRLHYNPSAPLFVISVPPLLSSQCSDTGIQSFHNHQRHCISQHKILHLPKFLDPSVKHWDDIIGALAFLNCLSYKH
ncbi:MAG: hypothetical protein ACR5K9_07570 [Wolbachia sp.]